MFQRKNIKIDPRSLFDQVASLIRLKPSLFPKVLIGLIPVEVEERLSQMRQCYLCMKFYNPNSNSIMKCPNLNCVDREISSPGFDQVTLTTTNFTSIQICRVKQIIHFNYPYLQGSNLISGNSFEIFLKEEIPFELRPDPKQKFLVPVIINSISRLGVLKIEGSRLEVHSDFLFEGNFGLIANTVIYSNVLY